MKITKTQLSQIIKEELKATLNEGLPPAYVQGREDAYDQNAWVNHLKNGGDAEPNLPDDSLYMKGWNEAIEEMRMEAGDYDDREFGGDPNSFGDANDGYNYDDMYENKITKSQLAQIVKEEAEVVQEVYWPFIGGKVDANQLYRAKSRLEHSREKLNKYKSAMEDSDIRWADEWMSEMEEVLKSISKRHKKHEFEHAEKVWVRRQQDVEEILRAGSKAWNQQNRANSREEYERESDEKARDSRRKRSDREDSRRAYEKSQQDDSDDAFMGQHHRSNPGFAGTGNMGYGESLDRAKISKSELAQIIKEELNQFFGGSELTPEQQTVTELCGQLTEAVYEMERSNPDMTDTYLILFRALAEKGLNLKFMAGMA